MQSFVRMQKYASAQSREYDQGVVEVLKEELMDTTKDFRKVLEVGELVFRDGPSAPSLLGKPIVYQSRSVCILSLPHVVTAA